MQLAEARKREAELKRAVPVPVVSTKEGDAELKDLVFSGEAYPVDSPSVTKTGSSGGESGPMVHYENRIVDLENQVEALTLVVEGLVRTAMPKDKVIRNPAKSKAKKSSEALK
jgi:hypothetical protein